MIPWRNAKRNAVRFRIAPKHPTQIIIRVPMACALRVVHAPWTIQHVSPTALHAQMDAIPSLLAVIIVSMGCAIHQPVVLADTMVHRATMNAKANKFKLLYRAVLYPPQPPHFMP
jgi:hypothetical protein